jgi:hypothetical protein
MNSDWFVAMDMPPCDVFAMMTGGIGYQFQIDGESRQKNHCEQERAPIALKQMVGPPRLLQIFRAAA